MPKLEWKTYARGFEAPTALAAVYGGRTYFILHNPDNPPACYFGSVLDVELPCATDPRCGGEYYYDSERLLTVDDTVLDGIWYTEEGAKRDIELWLDQQADNAADAPGEKG